MVRLSFAIRPPDDVLSVLSAVPRPLIDNVTWSTSEQWIVKLRPLGHVPANLQEPLIEAVQDELEGAHPVRASMGPVTQRLAGQWLGVSVAGLDDLAAAVFAASAPIVPITHPQPFRADLVLARGRVPKDLAGVNVRAEWTVTTLLLIADHSAPGRIRLDDVARIRLAP